MQRTRALGFALLGLSLLSIVGAAAIGVLATLQAWSQDRIIGMTAVLAVFAEVCFWTGGGMVGFSAIRRRREAAVRFVTRFGPRRREDWRWTRTRKGRGEC